MTRASASWFLTAAVASLAAAVSASWAQTPAAPAAAPAFSGPSVTSVRAEGVTGEDSTRTLAVFAVTRGSTLTAPVLREALRRVWTLGLYDDLWVEGAGSDTAVAVVVHATPRPRIRRLEFTGNKKIKSEDLAKKTGISPGMRLSSEELYAAVDSVTRVYREKGYVRADVRTETRAGGPSEVDLQFTITEGPSARVKAFTFEGVRAFPEKQLRKQLASKKKGFLKSGKVDPDKLAKDVDKLTEFYRARGYRDVRVDRDSLRFSPDGKAITLGYRVAEGPRYRMGSVAFTGEKAITESQKKAIKLPVAGDWYNGTAVKKAVEDTYAAYAEQGYLYVAVDPREEVNDSLRVDLTLAVQEGAPSRLRRVIITGNTRTKEKVVRRELTIHEGDLFRRSLLIRSQQDVFRLGFFQDVQVDFRAADSTDVDLYFKVVEKETGTASAGAGYSSEGGLTGFVQLGHNNLFGSGQSINIALERGSRRSTYDISYSDPWFRDSRTTLGFSIFNRDQETEVVGSGTTLNYRDKRYGGSIRVGRPLRKIDHYTRGYMTYRLEQVNIEADSATTAPQQELAKLLQQGRRTTSSVELTLSRDNTINPFYPTGGTRSTVTNEFAGHLLGGQVGFHKHEADVRWWFPSLIKPITSMLRLRGGMIGNYGKDVPAYERFRLGGTTFYGVRGYEDFEIVPPANIHEVTETIAVVDTAGDTTFTTRTSEIRYPGGRMMSIVTFEQQFPIVHPLHGVIFADAGGAWNEAREIQPFKLKRSAGLGFRIEVPLLGNLGLDFGYGFDKTKPGWRTHFLLGNMFF